MWNGLCINGSCRIHDRCLEGWIFKLCKGIDFSVEHVEENPTMVQDVGLDETVAIIILNVDISGQAQEKLKDLHSRQSSYGHLSQY